tara:strand:+ start:160 stop:501 length:342 start_codon:yes stop_codon:yes gene_type:complete
MNLYNSRGNSFFIEIIPEITSKGQWTGAYQLAINARRTNLNEESYFGLENLCQMTCAALTLMEQDDTLKERIWTFLDSPSEPKEKNPKDSLKKYFKENMGNVIKIDFKPTKQK